MTYNLIVQLAFFHTKTKASFILSEYFSVFTEANDFVQGGTMSRYIPILCGRIFVFKFHGYHPPGACMHGRVHSVEA